MNSVLIISGPKQIDSIGVILKKLKSQREKKKRKKSRYIV